MIDFVFRQDLMTGLSLLETFKLHIPSEEFEESKTTLRDAQNRAIGCVMGALIGDSSGSTLEYVSKQ